MKRIAQLVILSLGLSWGVLADPAPYEIDREKSLVGFGYTFGSDTVLGEFPNYDANLILDLEDPSNSSVQVTLNTQSAKAGFVFATNAFRSKQILDTENHPTMFFQSTSISGTNSTAFVTGNITIRGVTRPLTMKAKLSRLAGSASNDFDRLNIVLDGSVNRHDFGASGYRNDVGDIIDININAWIDRQ